MFNIKKLQLELVSNADMYYFFEKGMKGGIFYISKRYKLFNILWPKTRITHIIHLEMNNL